MSPQTIRAGCRAPKSASDSAVSVELEPLTPRELEVASWIGRGKRNDEIARIFERNMPTVKRSPSKARSKRAPTSPPFSPTSALPSGARVGIPWGWSGYAAFLDICEIQVDRSDSKGFAMLTFDTTPNYTDTTPFPTTPTKWTYRAIYRVGDSRVGQWSKLVSVTAGGEETGTQSFKAERQDEWFDDCAVELKPSFEMRRSSSSCL
jgi:hypothetical protein